MSRDNIPYPIETVGSLAHICEPIYGSLIGTITSSDEVGITSKQKFHKNLIRQEIIAVDNGFDVKVYLYDENDSGLGFPINQYQYKITVSGGTANIAFVRDKDNQEHWLAKLPQRVCDQLGCNRCSNYTLTTSGSTVGCCLTPWIQNGVMEQK